MLLLSVLLLLAATDASLFPKACLPSNTYPTICCPPYPPVNGSACGVNEGRGTCVRFSTSRADPDMNNDDRYIFPDNYFHSRCRCNNNFASPNCGRCKPGYQGARCDQPHIVQHREYRELSLVEQEELKVQMQYCKDLLDPDYYILQAGDRLRSITYRFIEASYYDVWCFTMYYFSQSFIWNGRTYGTASLISGSSSFLNSNRLAVFILQDQMQRCLQNNSFIYPYYDMQADVGCDLCTNDHFGANDKQGYLSQFNIYSSWRALCADYAYVGTYCVMSDCICERPKITRRPGMAPGWTKPTTANIQRCVNMTVLDTAPYGMSSSNSFRNCIEVMFMQWRQYVGGTMSQDALAYNDPMMPLVMVFIMKIQERWMHFKQIPRDSYPRDNPNYGHRAGDCCMPDYGCTTNGNMMVPLSDSNIYFSYFNQF